MSRPPKPIKRHDRVFHTRLEADGIVLETMANGRYRVGIGSLSVECTAAELVAQKAGPTAYTKKSGETRKGLPSRTAKAPSRSCSTDLHGMTVDEGLTALANAIDSALRGGADRLAIIHGHGTGRMKAAVHRYLKTLSVVKRFKLDDGNSGTTLAYF